jgi:hypothetical protein
VIRSFLVGTIVGGAAVWLYGPQMRAFFDDKTRNARSRAADTLQAAAEGLHSTAETLESGLSGERRLG